MWSTFYDIRRYGGLQIFLRAALTGTSLVLKGAQESTADFLDSGRRSWGHAYLRNALSLASRADEPFGLVASRPSMSACRERSLTKPF